MLRWAKNEVFQLENDKIVVLRGVRNIMLTTNASKFISLKSNYDFSMPTMAMDFGMANIYNVVISFNACKHPNKTWLLRILSSLLYTC
jgi:hypothetical protein